MNDGPKSKELWKTKDDSYMCYPQTGEQNLTFFSSSLALRKNNNFSHFFFSLCLDIGVYYLTCCDDQQSVPENRKLF